MLLLYVNNVKALNLFPKKYSKPNAPMFHLILRNIIVDEDSKTLHYPVPVIWFKPLKKVKVPTSDER